MRVPPAARPRRDRGRRVGDVACRVGVACHASGSRAGPSAAPSPWPPGPCRGTPEVGTVVSTARCYRFRSTRRLPVDHVGRACRKRSVPGFKGRRYPTVDHGPTESGSLSSADPQHGHQHSMTLTARPPRAVSLYLTFMSAPVSRIVLMTLSSETRCCPSPRSASRAAVIALMRRDRVALDARDLHQAADRIAGQAEVVLHRDLGGVLDLRAACRRAPRSGRPRPSSRPSRPRPGSRPRHRRSRRSP